MTGASRLVFAAVCLTVSGCASVSGPKPLDVFRDCRECPEMVALAAGTFVMGADGKLKRERPAHAVTIERPFAIGRHEVTFDEWQVCLEAGACTRVPDDHKWGRGRRPVMNVSFQDAEDYVRWLSDRTGQTYRLPTEAEWEYAARGRTTTEYSWGDRVGTDNANCRTCAPTISHRTFPVGSYRTNPFGLYDVHGNVWEWVQDCWNPTHEGAPSDASARLTGDCRYRVTRSGSWYYVSTNLRSAYRSKFNARAFSYGIGIRVVRELP